MSEGGDAEAAGFAAGVAAGLAAAEPSGAGGGRQAGKEGGNRQSRRQRSKRAGRQALVGGAKGGFSQADLTNSVGMGGGRKGLNLNTQPKRRPRTRLDFVEAEVRFLRLLLRTLKRVIGPTLGQCNG